MITRWNAEANSAEIALERRNSQQLSAKTPPTPFDFVSPLTPGLSSTANEVSQVDGILGINTQFV
jgi:hypothetical protein